MEPCPLTQYFSTYTDISSNTKISRIMAMYSIRRASLISIVFFSLCSASTSYAQKNHKMVSSQPDMLYKISQFVAWPHYIMNQHNLLFCFYGDNINQKEYQVLNGLSLHHRKIRVFYILDIKQIQDCQLLFTTTSDPSELKLLTVQSKKNAILTISPNKDFIKNGGMVQLNLKDNTTQLHINPSQIKASNLSVSSSLLSIAQTQDNE